MAKREEDLGNIRGRIIGVASFNLVMDNTYIDPSIIKDEIKLYKGDLILIPGGVMFEIYTSPYDEGYNPDDYGEYRNCYVVSQYANLKGPQGAQGPQGKPGAMNIILKQETDTGDMLAGDKIYCRGMKITIFGENEIDYMYKTGLTGTDLCWIDMSNSFLYNETLAVTSPLVQHSTTDNNTVIPSNVEVYLSKNTTSGEIEFHIKGNYPGINLCCAYITFRYTKK